MIVQSDDITNVINTDLPSIVKMWLPYDHLSNSETQFSSASVHDTLPYTQITSFLDFSDSSCGRDSFQQNKFALLIAATSLLLHRYASSKLQQIPTSYFHPGRSKWSHAIVSTNVDDKLSFEQYLNTIKDKISTTSFTKQQLDETKSNFHLSFIDLNDSKNPKSSLVSAIDSLDIETDINIVITAGPSQLDLKLNFNNNCFNRETVKKMLNHLCNLLKQNQIVTPIKDFAILDPEEIQWLKDVGHGNSYEEKFCTIAQRFEAWVLKQPNAIAIEDKNTQLSYQELNLLSNRLSHYLTKCELSSQAKIVVFVKPNVDILISLLAIFKLGGTYIPIDPGFPAERIKIILKDVDPDIILTQREISEQIRTSGIKLIELDPFHEIDTSDIELLNQPVSNPDIHFELQQTASIFYTSGTTGKPKGVMASYANINHYVNVARRKYDFNANDIIPAIAKFTFSISLFELLLPVASGGKSLVLDREHILDLDQLASRLQQVTFAHIGPSLLKALVAQVKSYQPPFLFKLRHISSGGDMIPPELITDLQSLFPVAEIHVIYGCSEISCMGVTNFILSNHDIKKLFVGKPFVNVIVHILDESLNLVPQGCIGNVCFAGDGLVKGYLNLPELTQEKFFNLDGKRFYNTGDRGRLNALGELELLGREDFQVQILGIRIELGEIEYYLRQAPGVKDAVVNINKDKSLIAYVVKQYDQDTYIQKIRDYLLKNLPDYMLPSQYMFLEKLPLNHNLKVDRKALPEFKPFADENIVVAKTKIEKKIASIWQELIAVRAVSIRQDFFETGGDSLLVTQLRTRINQSLAINIPLNWLFRYSNIENLAQNIKSNLETISQHKTDRLLTVLTKIEQVDQVRTMSFAQQRLWYLEQLNPNTPLYNIPIVIKFTGKLEVKFIAEFFDVFVDKHEVLRTSFVQKELTTQQFIREKIEFKIGSMDFRNESETEIQKFLQTESVRPFDLTRVPLFRVNLLKTSENETILSLVIHHIIFDAQSLDILLLELKRFFQGENISNTAAISNDNQVVNFQYADYAKWQKQWITSGGGKYQLRYWLERLAGELPRLSLPEQKKRPLEQSVKGATETITLSRKTAALVGSCCRRNKVTPYMYFFSIYLAALYRYSGQQDIIVGTPIANRNLKETEAIVGFFVNTLPIRISIDKKQTFSELLQRVKAESLLAFDNQDVPFENLVAELKPRRDPSCTPIFQTMFNYLKIGQVQSINHELSMQILPWAEVVSKTDLSFIVHEQAKGYQLSLEYCSDIFDKEFINKFLLNISTLLDSVLDNQTVTIEFLELLSEQEKQLLIVGRNQSERCLGLNSNLLKNFIGHCYASPEKIAVKTDKQQFTYRQLDQQARALADHLITNGVLPGSVVAMLLARSEKLIVSILAIFYAGATYLPLDPEYPEERVRYILDNANADLLLLEEKFYDLISDPCTKVIDIDQVLSGDLVAPDILPRGLNDALAYIIYTSGSTGNPKGVMVTQENLGNFLFSMANKPGMSEKDIVLAVTTISFDIAVLELLLPLFVGATAVIVDRLSASDPTEISRLLNQHAITLMQATPTTWRMLLRDNWQGKSDLKVLVGGEALPQNLSSNLFDKVSEIWNMYGPTETTIWSSCYRIKNVQDVPKIGRPIDNTQVYILDENLHLVPDGVVGELCIAGQGVSRGYLGDVQLTSQKYVKCPFSTGRPSNLYKTGDQVRYDVDGNIEYIGRIDFQVKVRGYRIELGEIETALNRMPQISQSVVMLREDKRDDQRIVAYYISESKGILKSEFLRESLREILPTYMLPHHFIELDIFPLTPNGKIDRQSLQPPTKLGAASESKMARPTSATEKRLAKIWQEQIGEKNVGIHDLFFELGGHSLLALQTIAQVKKEFKFKLTPLMMIRETLQKIAARIDGKDFSELSNIQMVNDKPLLLPFFFGPDNSLYGTLHKPKNGESVVGAVLLCSPLYMEGINSQWAFKRLASQLAQQGFHVLRFDYTGTGDSWGDSGCCRVSQWIKDIDTAVTELCKLTGQREITIIGLRFGATLAAHCDKDIVKKLVLWEPVVAGQQFVDELLGKTHRTITNLQLEIGQPTRIDKQEIVGYYFPDDVRESIAEIDLISGRQIRKVSQLLLLTASTNTYSSEFKQKLSINNQSFQFKYFNDPSPAIESYTTLETYLPRKSLSVIVDMITEGIS